jgi:hypothetical protein
MQQTASLTLATLHCVREKESSSSPYLWTALVVIDESSLAVIVVSPLNAADRVVIQNNLQAGQSASIPSSVGLLSFQFDLAITKTDAILVAALWQKHDTPGNVVDAGFDAFTSTLKSAITDNLINLASTDPQTQQAAIDKVKSTVKDSVTSAISNSLSTPQKIEVKTGLLTLDSLVDSSSQVLSSLAPTSFTITLGGALGGRLLSYGDNGTPGNVSNPVVVGFGGWSGFKFLFAGGNRIYAVDQSGQLLSYGDSGAPGNVSNPVVVGFGGWSDFKFLFAGGDRIYAVDQNGQLLSYGDNGTPGNVSNPVVVGFGGWSDFKFLFAGGDRIYAAENALTPDHHYEIDCTLQVTADTCVTEKNGVNAAKAVVQSIEDQITALQAEAQQAIGPQKLFLLKQIRDLEKNQLGPAQAALDQANKALAACLAHSS